MPHHDTPLPGHAAPERPDDAELAAILAEITGPSGQFRHRHRLHDRRFQ